MLGASPKDPYVPMVNYGGPTVQQSNSPGKYAEFQPTHWSSLIYHANDNHLPISSPAEKRKELSVSLIVVGTSVGTCPYPINVVAKKLLCLSLATSLGLYGAIQAAAFDQC